MKKNFDDNDWNHMNSCILHATWDTVKKKSSREELSDIFDLLPHNLQADAFKWGMSDTCWRDNFIEWCEDNIEIICPKN